MRNGIITNQILKALAIGSLVVASSLLAPQLPYLLLKEHIKKTSGKRYSNQQIINGVNYLKRKKFIAFRNTKSQYSFSLTNTGKQRLSRQLVQELCIMRHRWDNKWRLVIFDIPEAHRAKRHIFVRILHRWHFVHFQRSVFILPYKCEDQINKLTAYLKIKPYVFLLTTNRFKSDKRLLKNFRLKKSALHF